METFKKNASSNKNRIYSSVIKFKLENQYRKNYEKTKKKSEIQKVSDDFQTNSDSFSKSSDARNKALSGFQTFQTSENKCGHFVNVLTEKFFLIHKIKPPLLDA